MAGTVGRLLALLAVDSRYASYIVTLIPQRLTKRLYNRHVKHLKKSARQTASDLVDDDKDVSVHKKRTIEKKPHDAGAVAAAAAILRHPPDFVKYRLDRWRELSTQQKERFDSKKSEKIEIRLPFGDTVSGESWRTTPYEVAKLVNSSAASTAVVARLDGRLLWDLDRPLETSCSVEFLDFEDADGRSVFWHSSSHLLGLVLERLYGAKLAAGPAHASGFYYDARLEHNLRLTPADYPVIESVVAEVAASNEPFERLVLPKDEILRLFEHNDLKRRFVETKVTEETGTVYRCGTLIDLCRGPHVRHTGLLKTFKVTNVSCAFFGGNVNDEALQRVHGVAFPDLKSFEEWQRVREVAAARDHRKVGTEQELFFFHSLSPGSPFFLPHGTIIYNRLVDAIRSQYRKRGFQEVITPNIYNMKLWQVSGHEEAYLENMFKLSVHDEEFSLKPMNCPGHCLLFDSRPRSWRELPLRLAEFGVLHRNENMAALSGLTRLRRFQQDDAHIFCAPEQVKDEISSCLDFTADFYSMFGFDFYIELSTRPDDFLGTIESWDDAETQLKTSLKEFGHPWRLNLGDGAFYGPKIDISLKDAFGRNLQCATIQLDFNLPERFNLLYSSRDGVSKTRPVLIHRAILGSLERMVAVLAEHTAGKWPFWLSPRQVAVVPINKAFNRYAEEVGERLTAAGFAALVDTAEGTRLNKKIRNHQSARFNFILVVGERERSNGTVNVRTRDNKVLGERNLDHVIDRFKTITEEMIRESEEPF